MHTQDLAGIGFLKRFDSRYSRVEILHDLGCLRFHAAAIANMNLPFTCHQLHSPISKSGRPILQATIGGVLYEPLQGFSLAPSGCLHETFLPIWGGTIPPLRAGATNHEWGRIAAALSLL